MTVKYDVLIVGGGMVGSLLACALGDSDLKVAVLERTPNVSPQKNDCDLRVSAITLASRAIFEATGAWRGMEARRISTVQAMHIWEAVGSGSIHFDSAEIGEPCLAYIIENSVILAVLQERLQQFTNIHYLCPLEIGEINISEDKAAVTLKDARHISPATDSPSPILGEGWGGDRNLHARLLVGADGADSCVRQAVGIDVRGFSFDQKGIVATVTTEKPHARIARQRFLPTGPLAFLPLDEAHTSSIVWSADTVRADELLALDDTAFMAQLQEAFDALGKIQSVSPRVAFPLALTHAKVYTAPRAALIGDAAHTVHPLAGQGVNLGFLDAATLAEVLLEANAKKKDIGSLSVLRRYERRRKGDNLAMLAATSGFKLLFGSPLPGIGLLRNIGMDLTNAVTPIKNFIMRRASGLEGDLPKLARRVHS